MGLGELANQLAAQRGSQPSATRTYTNADVLKPRTNIETVLQILAPQAAGNPNAQPGDPDFDWSQYDAWKSKQVDPVADARPLVDQFNEEDRIAGDEAAAGEQAYLQDIADNPGREMAREVGHSIYTGELPLQVGLAMLSGGAAPAAASTAGRVGKAIMSAPVTLALEAASYLPGNWGRAANAIRTVQDFLGLGKGKIGKAGRAADAVADAPLPTGVLTGADQFSDVAKRNRRGFAREGIPYRAPASPRKPYQSRVDKLEAESPALESFEAGGSGPSIDLPLGKRTPLSSLPNKRNVGTRDNIFGEGGQVGTGRTGQLRKPDPRPMSDEQNLRTNPQTGETFAGDSPTKADLTESTVSDYPPRPGQPGFGRSRVRDDAKMLSQDSLTDLLETLRTESGLPKARITKVHKTPKPSGNSPTARAIRQRGHAFGEY